jgi:hypothetical protein
VDGAASICTSWGSMMRLETAAVAYATNGWAVFPLKPGEKVPAVRHGVKEATTDVEQVRAWWQRNPDFNIGVACGEPSGIFVLDVDGEEGQDSLVNLGHGFPATLTASTPSGGFHFVFRHLPGLGNTAGTIGPKLDTRGDGGYIVVAPSQVNGKEYRWGAKQPPDQIPGWLVTLVRKPLPRPARPISAAERSKYAERALTLGCERVAAAGEGTRNDTLNREAFSLGTLVGAGMLGREDVRAHLEEAAVACGLTVREASMVLDRAIDDGAKHPREVTSG